MQQKSEHWLCFLNAASCPLHKSGELGDKVIRLTEPLPPVFQAPTHQLASALKVSLLYSWSTVTGSKAAGSSPGGARSASSPSPEVSEREPRVPGTPEVHW